MQGGAAGGASAPGREAGATRTKQRAAAQSGQHTVPSVPRVEPFSLWQSAAYSQDPRVCTRLQPVDSERPVRKQASTQSGRSAQVTAGGAHPLRVCFELWPGPRVARRAGKARPDKRTKTPTGGIGMWVHICARVSACVCVGMCAHVRRRSYSVQKTRPGCNKNRNGQSEEVLALTM